MPRSAKQSPLETTNPSARVYALVAAAGVGSRAGADRPKQYLELAGVTVITRSISVLLEHQAVRHVVVCIAPHDQYWSTQAIATDPGITAVTGGADRALSVLAGLKTLLDCEVDPDSWVLVHDAARPLLRKQEISQLINAVAGTDNCGGILAVPVTDTIKFSSDSGFAVSSTPERARLWQAQTPQLFRIKQLHDAIESAKNSGTMLTDESSALEGLGLTPILVPGREDNIKITHATDMPLAEMLLERQLERHKERQ